MIFDEKMPLYVFKCGFRFFKTAFFDVHIGVLSTIFFHFLRHFLAKKRLKWLVSMVNDPLNNISKS